MSFLCSKEFFERQKKLVNSGTEIPNRSTELFETNLFLALTFKRPLNLPRPVYPRGGGGVTCNMKLRPSRHFCSVANSAIGLRSLVRVLFPICLTDKRGISFSGSIFGNMVVSFYVFRYLCVFSPQQLKYVHVFT